MFDLDEFLANLATFVGFKTIVAQNHAQFAEARAWIKAFFDAEKTTFVEVEREGFVSLLIRPKSSPQPKMLGDGHIEVVPGDDNLFQLTHKDGILYGRGVADMKTQCLMMMTALRDLIASDQHNDFWILFTEDEEIGSCNGVRHMVDWLDERGWLPEVIFAPDGGADFAYVEKEKGIVNFSAIAEGKAAHGSRPFLGDNAIDRIIAFYHTLQGEFPNPSAESDWRPSLSLTKIKAGSALNQIPDRCEAGFDMRFTEDYALDEVLETLEAKAEKFGVTLRVHQSGLATYYPRERPLVKDYLDILQTVTGREPTILHANGASNGRIYVAKNPNTQVFMSSPTYGGSHAATECLEIDSLEPYYRLVCETIQLL